MNKQNNEARWSQDGNFFRIADVTSQVKNLPQQVYHIRFIPNIGPVLEAGQPLEMPDKVYGLERGFIDRLLYTFENSGRKNVACLLSGIQGAGKTVTAKLAALETGLPVILLNGRSKEHFDFINAIPQDIVVIFDELEKVYHEVPEQEWVPLLSTLDGLSNANYRRLWIMTSNTENVSQYILDRVGRVRYHKKFSGLSEAQITEIVNDKLPTLTDVQRRDIVMALRRLKTRTVDSVTGFCSEVSLFNKVDPAWIMNDFNLAQKPKRMAFMCQPLTDEGEVIDVEPTLMWETTEGADTTSLYLKKEGLKISHKNTGSTLASVVGHTPDGKAILKKYCIDWGVSDQFMFTTGRSPRYRTDGSQRTWEEVAEIINADPILWLGWCEELPPVDDEGAPAFNMKSYSVIRNLVSASDMEDDL